MSMIDLMSIPDIVLYDKDATQRIEIHKYPFHT